MGQREASAADAPAGPPSSGPWAADALLPALASGLAAASAALGAVGLAGWLSDAEALTRLGPGERPIHPLLALTLVVSGAGAFASSRRWRGTDAAAAGALAVAVAEVVARLLELDPFGVRFSPSATGAAVSLGLGAALVCAWARRARAAEALALATWLLATPGVLRHFFAAQDEPLLDRATWMAFSAASGAVLVSVSLVLSCPGGTLARLLSSPRDDGLVLRRLFAAALVLPPVLGGLLVLGERGGVLSAELGITLFVTAGAGLIVAIAARTALRIERLEAVRQAAVAEQERLRTRLVAADRLASVGTLAAGVAHEVNNPLTYVCSNLDFVGGRGLPELANCCAACRQEHGVAQEPLGQLLPELRAAVDEARHGADRVRSIVRDLKLFARAEEDRPVTVDVREVVESSLQLAGPRVRQSARLERALDEAPKVRASPAQLGQVVLNLLVNAAEALEGAPAGQHAVRVSTGRASDGRAFIEVEDDGPGIPAHFLPRLFEPFFTTKPVGRNSGLGLSVAHGLVAAMGGEFTVDTAAGRGARFRVLLPPAEPPRVQPL